MVAQCLGCTKTIWSRTNPADANNLIDIAARCLLIEDGDRLILIDTEWEISNQRNFLVIIPVGTHSMDKSLAKHGFHRDVTDVL
jgi:hypothetical protein